MQADRYEIRTLQDFARIPSDRLEACLRDFQYAIELHKLAHGSEAANVEVISLDWADDGNHSVTALDAEGKPFLELRVEDSPVRTLDAAPSDAAIARALEWLRNQVKPCSAEERECMSAIEEAVAAYEPPEVRTVQRVREPSAEHWRRAVNELAGKLSNGERVESRLPFSDYGEWALNRAREIAREGK